VIGFCKKLIEKYKRVLFYFTHLSFYKTFKKFKRFTMIRNYTYIKNLSLVRLFKKVEGVVVECGTWRGGMIAGIACLLGNEREYYLFDSFEGLPEVKEIDGTEAIKWQNDKDSPFYFDNCKADFSEAQKAMLQTGCNKFHIIKGWFEDTLNQFPDKQIAVLRLDGDWYDSTITCLENLFDKVSPGGIIIIDDYTAWDGCSKAVHDFLSKKKRPEKIRQWENEVAYIIKI
jgi:O-methyltransferase